MGSGNVGFSYCRRRRSLLLLLPSAAICGSRLHGLLVVVLVLVLEFAKFGLGLFALAAAAAVVSHLGLSVSHLT